MDGRVDVRVVDSSGGSVPATVVLASRSVDFRATGQADSAGRLALRRIPAGAFLLTVSHDGFSVLERRVEIRSAVPEFVEVVLEPEPVREQVTVRAAPPLFEPLRPSQPVRLGRRQLAEGLGTVMGRSAVDVVTTTPGWLLEANAVLHPRGSEYDTQYVIDGMPLYDNRSIAFAPAFIADDFESVSVLTAGIPAEYGRRLGGVIALDTRRSPSLGNRSTAQVQGGSFAHRTGYLAHQRSSRRTEILIGVQGGTTHRYLDPPSVENFTNQASSSGFNARLSRDLPGRDRLSAYFRTSRTGFLVPNDLEQQEAGQRQDRRSAETSGQLHYQAVLSLGTLLSLRGMVRDVSSKLWSNELTTPVYVLQDRGLREGAIVGDITVQREGHTIKIGGDARWNWFREDFKMAEPDKLPAFDLDFLAERRSTEASAYLQDQFRFGGFAATVGLRFDHYSLLVSDTAISPRLAASYYIPQASLQLFASYDRIFQPPPTENLLLSSAATGLGIDAVEGLIAVPTSRADFVEVGLRRPIGDLLRVDVKHFWRDFSNYIDDDVFLNTGLSFPITFDSAQIQGTEVRLEIPRWKGVSSYVSYSNLLGRARSPVTGGLFIEGGEAEELRDVSVEFPISQDQRNTVAAMVRFQIHPRVWTSFGVRYGSGLPVELEDDDDDDDHDHDDADGDHDDDEGGGSHPEDGDADEEQPIPESILGQINFDRGRVRPNLSLDFSVGARVWTSGPRSAELQFDLRNAADRLNVINFSGLFSGTALAPGRQFTVQLRLQL